MANTLITPTIITREALVEFKNEMVMLAKVDRQLDSQFRKIGDSIQVRRRVRYAAVDGPDITGVIANTIEGDITVSMSFHKVVPLEFSITDLTLTVEEFSERYIKPAAIELVQQVESTIADQYKKIFWFTGTPGTTPATLLDIGNARAIQTLAGVPAQGRTAFYDPTAITALSDGLKGVFPQDIALPAIRRASIGVYQMYQVTESASIATHTVGALGGTPAVDGAAQNVTYLASKDGYSQTLNVDGWTISITDILLAGDVFTIADVFAVNPRTRKTTGNLQTFTVLADATSTAGGLTALTISPPIIIDDTADNTPYQTVDSVPADGALITIVSGAAGSQHPQNLLFHKDAITVAFARLEPPEGNATFRTEVMDNVAMQYTADYDILQHKNIYRLDVLFAVEAQNPGMAIRHTG